MIGSDGVPLDIMKGATATSDGVGGLMPASSDGYPNLLCNDGTYKFKDVKFINSEFSNDELSLYMLSDKSDKITVPSIQKAVESGYAFGLMPRESKEELDKLANSYQINYDRAKLVYHSWNPYDGAYNSADGENYCFKNDEVSPGGETSSLTRYDLKGNDSTQTNPWYYPIIENDSTTNRSDRRTMLNSSGNMVRPVHAEYYTDAWASYTNNANRYVKINKLVFDIPGLYAVYSRFWVRANNTNHRRVSLCPYINGESVGRYRDQLTTLLNTNQIYTHTFFQYFNEGDYLTFGVFPVDTVSDSNYVSFAFSDLCIYAINWDSQLQLITT